jgi:protein O-GlcNAc transferase
LRHRRKEYAASADAFRNCTRISEGWLDAWVNLGLAEWRAGNGDSAKAALQTALNREPGCVAALTALGALAVESGDYIEALERETTLAELGESTPELSYNAGVLLQQAGLNQEAAACYRRAADLNPEFGEALLNLGHALKALGQEGEARDCWKRAVDARPELAAQYFEPVEA